jgi:hypothetical protein
MAPRLAPAAVVGIVLDRYRWSPPAVTWKALDTATSRGAPPVAGDALAVRVALMAVPP